MRAALADASVEESVSMCYSEAGQRYTVCQSVGQYVSQSVSRSVGQYVSQYVSLIRHHTYHFVPGFPVDVPGFRRRSQAGI